MQKTTLWVSALALIVVLVGVFVYMSNSDAVNEMASESAIRKVVTDFGGSLKMVSLLANRADVALAIDENYSTYITPELLNSWKSDPAMAPGRVTSSPYPNAIKITSVEKNPDSTYTVTGSVVEASNSTGTTTEEGEYPVTLTLENRSGAWLISNFQGYIVQ